MKKIYTYLLAITFLSIALPSYAALAIQQELNKQNAIAFCHALMNEKDFAKARGFIGEHYIQHNAKVEDGIEGLRKYMEYFRAVFPKLRVEIKRATADDNFVYLHLSAVMLPNTKGYAVVDIFRFENGKIVEHWDVTEEVPRYSMNNNGVF